MNTYTILLVEDEQLDVISVSRSLKKLDIPYHLFTAFNGVEALEMLQGTGEVPAMDPLPDIILLDLNMPVMNGIEFLQVLRANAHLNHLKVFVMTTSGEQTDRSLAEGLNVAGYLLKPMNYGTSFNREDSMEHFMQFHIRNILLNIEK